MSAQRAQIDWSPACPCPALDRQGELRRGLSHRNPSMWLLGRSWQEDQREENNGQQGDRAQHAQCDNAATIARRAGALHKIFSQLVFQLLALLTGQQLLCFYLIFFFCLYLLGHSKNVS